MYFRKVGSKTEHRKSLNLEFKKSCVSLSLIVEELQLVVEGPGPAKDGGPSNEDPGPVHREADCVRGTVTSVPGPRG